jgi:hypothetical protein
VIRVGFFEVRPVDPRMPHDELATASDHLERAADAATGDRADRLREQATAMADLSEASHGADHGRLARHEHTLRELSDGASDAVREEVDAALSAISAFRETVEGV